MTDPRLLGVWPTNRDFLCATCGHMQEEHVYGGRCDRWLIAGAMTHDCPCTAFVSLSSVLGEAR